jgi:glucose/arabinose dehydrogenase
MLAFGPDGYLWIGMGDGGGSNDRFRQAQRPDTLLGAMLRVTVGVPGVETYAIPPDNPYADGVDGAPEVYWIGLRNPWRFSFDGSDVWVADVGQDAIEEVNVTSAGEPALNFGWPVMEGSRCFQTSSCDASPFVLPVDEYMHSPECSVTGGYVYRGSSIPEIAGQYFFSDFCSGFLASFSLETGRIDWTDQVGGLGNVSSFGVGGDGELYVVDRSGSIARIVRSP